MALNDKTKRSNSTKLVIDNDAGADDAMGIFLALHYEKHFKGPEVVGLLTTHGNVEEDQAYINNQKILKVAKRQDVPIYRGKGESIVKSEIVGGYFGNDGLGDSDETVSGLVSAHDTDAVNALLELSHKHKGNLVVVTLGTLTNVALAIGLDPNFLKRLKHLYIAAGHIRSDRFPKAEFNAKCDVEAYHIVMEHATPDFVTVIPFSEICVHLDIPMEWRTNTLGVLDTDVVKAMNVYERVSTAKSDKWLMLDPAAVACAINEDIVTEYKYTKNNIHISGSERGINTNEFVDIVEANARLIYATDVDKYKKFLLDVFSLE